VWKSLVGLYKGWWLTASGFGTWYNKGVEKSQQGAFGAMLKSWLTYYCVARKVCLKCLMQQARKKGRMIYTNVRSWRGKSSFHGWCKCFGTREGKAKCNKTYTDSKNWVYVSFSFIPCIVVWKWVGKIQMNEHKSCSI
jgi:hypothetical protein